jgi:hypothetical protein
MIWHHATTTLDNLVRVVAEIRRHGGTVASCRRCAEGMLVTWFTT